MASKEPITIDGSLGEGGGQILRTSLALSAVLGKPVRIVNIRARRKNPGLQRQHLTGVMALARLAKAHVKGAEIGSTQLEFWPRGLEGGEYEFNIGTAGSVTLVFQALMPVLAFLPKPTRITVQGGTDVPWSPTIDYLRHVVAYHLEAMGLKVEIELHQRGHYPKGGGRVTYTVGDPPGKLKPLYLPERGSLIRIEGISHAYRLPRHVAERQASSARHVLEKAIGKNIQVAIRVEHEPTRGLGPGSGITLWAITEKSILGSDSLGARGKPAEKVGGEAARTLVEDLATGASLDRHMSDMVIPLLALAEGESKVRGARLTLHARTNIEVVKILMQDVSINLEGEADKPFLLTTRRSPP